MYAALVPVGPDEAEVGRLHELLAELRRHERADEIELVLVDDAPSARDFGLDWPSLTTVRTPLWAESRPDTLSAHVAGTLEGLARVRDAEFVVKLDTDAAVIAPFSAALRRVFEDPEVGVVGSYDRMAGGGQRDWSMWQRPIDRATRPISLVAGPSGPRLRRRSREHRRTVAETRRAAYAVAPPGAHCLGGAYAASHSFLQGASLDWRPWIHTDLGEDVVIGLLCSHAGLRMKSLTAPGEPFALAWKGLPASPEALVADGHSIVHSVRCADLQQEQALRRQLQG